MAISSKITLDGEREFKRALAEINAGLRVTASELTLVTAKYSDNATSVKALTEKNEVLERHLFSQQEKVEKLREALAASAQKYGEADSRTMKWQASLNRAEAELAKIEKEIQNNNKAVAAAQAGYQGFDESLKQIDTGLKTTASAMALVTAKYSENAGSVVALSEKNALLQTKHEQLSEKVSVLRQALEKSKEVYGENDVQTQKWQQSLNAAETELIQVDKELKKNSEALEEAKKNMEKYGLSADEVAEKSRGIGGIISDLADKLGINLPAGADKAIKALDGTKVSTLALVGAVAGLVKGFADTTIQTAKTADEILTLASTSGLATDTIQKMNYASELLDVSTETITGSMTRMIRSLSQAQKGTGDAADAFRKLHVNIRDSNGRLKDSETLFYQVIDALGKVRNETERDALAMQIFGRSARELNPLIEAGSSALKELGDEAERMGYVMDENTLQRFGALDDAMQRFKNQTQAFKQSIGLVLLPVLTALFETLNKIDPKIIATVAIIGSIAVVVVTVAKAIKNVTDLFGSFNVATFKTTAIVLGVVAALIALATVIAVIIGKGNELNKTMANIGQSVGQVQSSVYSAQRMPQYAYVHGSHADGLDYVPFDGYIARLHRGERVLTAEEARRGTGNTFIFQVKMDEIGDVQKLIKVAREAEQMSRAGRLVMV